VKIEPIAAECFEQARADYLKLGKPVPPETMTYLMALSQAESLKRIADRLETITTIFGDGSMGQLNVGCEGNIDVRNNY
jgi:hypothetical protein